MSPAPSVYIETSVVSSHVARRSRDVIVPAHQEITLEWWNTRLPLSRPFISEHVLSEAERGDSDIARRRLAALESVPVLPTTAPVQELARLYPDKWFIPEAEPVDAPHLAVATVHEIECLVS